MKSTLKTVLIAGGMAGAMAMVPGVADASHFRGAAFIPVINGNGLLTITETSFWRKSSSSAAELQPTVNGLGTTFVSSVLNTSDSRYDVRTVTYTRQLSGAGTYSIVGSSCCRVRAGGLANWSESSETMNAAIVWDGSNATSPINFSFATLQPEVSRLAGNDYSQNLNATSPDGLTLTYNQALNQNINFQVPGFTVNTTTGLLTIVGTANRAQITDNTSNAGADAAFSGNIIANNGSFVEFDWMFDGVDLGTNQAPTVADAVINALVGPGPILHTFTATDPEDGALTGPPGSWDANLVLGAGFTGALPTFNVLTQQLSWDTTGYAAGAYNIQARAFDSLNVGDFGLLTVNLCATPNDRPCATTPPPPPPPPGVPVPGTLFLMGLGLTGLGWRTRRHSNKV